jgi:ATP-dependent RNA helicase DHX37/DHR1
VERNTKQQDVTDDSFNNKIQQRHEMTTTDSPKDTPASIDMASHLMASLVSLKNQQTSTQHTQNDTRSELERIALQEEQRPKTTRYQPTPSVVLQTAATLGLTATTTTTHNFIPTLSRPPDVMASRLDLPVVAMEYEIMDAIRTHAVTILGSETGSGKSTQVPQFLYEAGSFGNICITQPRRVAAVSTAQRVSYELLGRPIPRTQHVVAYQTRYESAGLGPDTRLSFMTDGILLQQVQSDLLLRQYQVIILDEVHERNLNTDVLVGLLCKTLQLRNSSSNTTLPPLKLVLMSATIRVQDFCHLFETPPAVVTVPGRRHPVTIHHAKVTELTNYIDVALRKVIQIHQALPAGGILLFVTGKQEIVTVIKKLRKRLQGFKGMCQERDIEPSTIDTEGLRDMDDDEMDGEVFVDDNEQDDDALLDTLDEVIPEKPTAEDKIPKKTIILPLHSMLSLEEQAKVFAPVPEGHRLIVVATNIAETSLTIPGISYVVDTGRQKCRNHHSGVTSYDIMWISKAAADQRAGRAGRTGPGHCYRLYSSSMYSRHMEDFAIPEVLTRPLEDVVLAMKAMNVSNIAKFPLPTPPDRSQIDGAIKLLANLGCLDIENMEQTGEDGTITRLGKAVAKLPLGVRYSKMLLVAANANVLDYGIAMVAVLSESSPFSRDGLTNTLEDHNGDKEEEEEGEDKGAKAREEKERRREVRLKWKHSGGDILAGVLAAGAYAYAGRGAGGSAEAAVCRRFCEENELSYAVMLRIHKMRKHLARLAKSRLSSLEGVAVRTGGVVSNMRPPNKLEESLLAQSISSGLLDNVAMLAPPGTLSGEHPYGFRSAYISCTRSEPLFMDPQSAVYSRDYRKLPQWVCFDQMVRKTTKDGVPVVIMKIITPIDSAWLGALSKGSQLLRIEEPIPSPPPSYDPDQDAITCAVKTKYGSKGWEITPLQAEMNSVLKKFPKNKSFFVDDSFRYFARFLLEGKVLPELKELREYLNEDPVILTRRTPIKKSALLVSALASAGVCSAHALREHWSKTDKKFLYALLMNDWIKQDKKGQAKTIWMTAVRSSILKFSADA